MGVRACSGVRGRVLSCHEDPPRTPPPHVYPQLVFSESLLSLPIQGWVLGSGGIQGLPLTSELMGRRGRDVWTVNDNTEWQGAVGTQEQQGGTCPPRGEEGPKSFPEEGTSDLGLKG